jgi:predicted unusual protein kinase regulating ubiquinone biosynthesis (AarF/ABC1/UbiB family)
MMGMLEEDLGARRSRSFADFEQQPIGVASIGQVYDVEESSCGERVLVTDHVEGLGFEALEDAPGEVRDRVPLLLREAIPPPGVLGRPASGQFPAP